MRNKEVILLTGVVDKTWNRAIGAYQLASFLRQNNINVQVIDFVHKLDEEFLYQTLIKFITKHTRFIGISTTFLISNWSVKIEKKDNLPITVYNVIKKIKKEFPKVKLVAGGANSPLFSQSEMFDYVIHGYAEHAFLKLLNGEIVDKNINGDNFLNEFDVARLNHLFTEDDFILQGETLPIEISRGCIFNCKFCSYPLNGKKKLDHLRDVELIKQELIHNYEKWGSINYYILDDTFNDNNEKLINLHNMIISLPFKINLVAYLRLDLLYTFQDTQLKLLEEMGLKSCHFGIESFNPTTAKFIGKGFNAEKSKPFLLELKKRWHKKISFTCTFIAGLPFESLDSCKETVKWCKENDIDFYMMPLAIRPNASYKSDIDKNYEIYGYRNVKNGSWESDLMTFKEALEISTINSDLTNAKISAWMLFSLLSAGLHDINYFFGKTYKDIDMQEYSNRYKEMLATYKGKLANG